jgi:PAS domain S-box-containing protein
MQQLNRYLNPINRLGLEENSWVFPLTANICLCIISEIYAYGIVHNPLIIGVYIIFFDIAFIIYFSFRDGIAGGIISTTISLVYYFYIIYTRHYSGELLASGIDTTIELGLVYLILAVIIGWLKQTIDRLIGRETSEKIWLQTILQQLAAGIIITDSRGRVVQSNKQLEQIFEVKVPQGFVIGQDTSALGRHENNLIINTVHYPLAQALKTKKSVFGKEFEFRNKNGKEITVQVNASVIRNKNKKVIAAASIITDITAQKDLERQKENFLNMASHELKTPITSLKIFIDLQKQQLKQDNFQKAKYFSERISDQVDRLIELINDLLDVSRIQTNKLRFNTELFDIVSIITDTVESLQATTAKHEILIEGRHKIVVFGDKYRMYQVLVNLLSNAIKYSPSGKKIIVKSILQKNSLIVSVQDFGIGISKLQQGKIFERLYQVTDLHQKTFPGLGLGLYISREIVRRHKGKIWVKSVKGKGSTFFFSLPLPANKM